MMIPFMRRLGGFALLLIIAWVKIVVAICSPDDTRPIQALLSDTNRIVVQGLVQRCTGIQPNSRLMREADRIALIDLHDPG